MNSYRLLFASISTLALFGCGLANTGSHDHSISISTGDDNNATDCNQVKIPFSGQPVARDEQDFTLTRKDASRLSVRPGNNGGIIVHGWDRAEYQIKACKAASGGSESDAHSRVGRISVSASDGSVASQDPLGDDPWAVLFIVQAPRGAVMQMETENGEIGVHGISGSIDANSHNGPISLEDCGGQVRAHTENGPIDVSGKSGDFHLDAHNGPISVHLTGSRWEGGGLDARTEDGPLTLKIPDGYTSGVSVEASGSSPFSCKASACHDVHGDWINDARNVKLGSGNTVVRLRTVNGPVTVESNNGRHEREDRNSDDNGGD